MILRRNRNRNYNIRNYIIKAQSKPYQKLNRQYLRYISHPLKISNARNNKSIVKNKLPIRHVNGTGIEKIMTNY